MKDFHVYFLAVLLVLQIFGTGGMCSKVGEPRAAYKESDVWVAIVLIFIHMYAFWTSLQ